MLTIYGQKNGGYCDKLSRRSFLRIGAMGFAGMALSDLFRLEAQAGVISSNKALINIFLGGGPSHTDMFDLKPDAPTEFRGEFNPIKTNVSGIEICEMMPRLAQMADKYAIVRSIVGTYDNHSSFHTQTGFDEKDLKSVGGRPALGSVVAKMQGGKGAAPAFVSLMGDLSPGFIGPVYSPYRPDGQGRSNLTLSRISADRLRDRTKLLTELDTIRRDVDSSGMMEAMDSFTQKAVEVVTSGRLADALNLEKEDPKVRQRYHGGTTERRGDTDNFLMARRLIEAGVRVVSTQWGGWDTHSDNFKTLRKQLPALDAALASLIQDLHERSMINDVTVIMWGEFGRTPRVNATAGRDHWSRVMQAFVCGGGIKGGQVVGTTDRYGGEATDRPVHLRDVFATMYHNLGIDAKRTTMIDPAGRPQYLVDGHDPIRELV
jgi:hypothetical protein